MLANFCFFFIKKVDAFGDLLRDQTFHYSNVFGRGAGENGHRWVGQNRQDLGRFAFDSVKKKFCGKKFFFLKKSSEI